jgi:hypothetical protein
MNEWTLGVDTSTQRIGAARHGEFETRLPLLYQSPVTIDRSSRFEHRTIATQSKGRPVSLGGVHGPDGSGVAAH